MAHSLQYLAEISGAEIVGDADCLVESIDVIDSAGPGQLTFLANPRYRKYLSTTRAAAVILSPEVVEECPTNALVSQNPYLAYARITHIFEAHRQSWGQHASAVVDSTALVPETVELGPGVVIGANVKLGDHVTIGPNCVIEADVQIGEGSHLIANVTVCHGVTIGARCLVHPGAVIGSDGFGLANERGKWVKIAQLGSVRIGNDVEIGANTAVDRGAIRDTVIEDGVKIDNLVQIAHNVTVGEDSAIAGCAGIAGSSTLGKQCMLGGGAGVQGHLSIADGTIVSGMAKVTRNIKEGGSYTGGVPAMPHKDWQKNVARVKKLDELTRRVQQLEKQLRAIETDTGEEN
ncbi:MAG: UDP-3-O-(3-hydroxymyristoyl)glucosamine N-acyltransferase [bacterium]